ncbi:MAG: hypothetical protein H7039_18845 [Bryobacteraceae bacterium]|nr:hypothetical protein [Bryobacteraceae bacterium]
MAYPFPPPNSSLLRIPSPDALEVHLCFAPLSDRDKFNPSQWRREPLSRLPGQAGWWEINVTTLALNDGSYEYEFVINQDRANPVADPFADEITRFGGYRGIFHIKAGQREIRSFRWDDELPAGITLPNNNQIVIYEMPVRWMVSGPAELDRQVGLATFDKVIFERLEQLVDLGINTIELLPVQDSPDTVNWGYGTRFFFTADIDMGTPIDLKYFVKRCHQLGVRVLLDVVMNHASWQCPLQRLAKNEYFIEQQDGRDGWGGILFRYDDNDSAREFHCAMGEYWIREYHVDGFRLDEFKSIKNYAFVQAFRESAWQEHQSLFPGRPFLIIAEDSNRRFEITRDSQSHPNGRKMVDSIWNFAYRDDARKLLTNQLSTSFGQASRQERIRMLISGSGTWDDYGGGSIREGYADLSQSVNYIVSHDVKDGARMMNELFGALLRLRGLGNGSVEDIRYRLKNFASQPKAVTDAHSEALERCRSAMALLLTSVGIPMFLAGEEFGDVHDLLPWEDTKMSDPVDWERRNLPGHRQLLASVRQLIRLRTGASALQRNEVAFFHMHPQIDQNEGTRVFAFCRTNGRTIGSQDQVMVIANLGSQNFSSYDVPWPWSTRSVAEIAPPLVGGSLQVNGAQGKLTLSLQPFQVRVIQS